MSETHFEPFVHLVDVGPERALIAWGGFWFRRDDPAGRWRVVEDERLDEVDPGRIDSIGARSASYGEAVVEVLDGSGYVVASARTAEVNHTWVDGLQPDTAYRYRITVDGRPWTDGERWEWGPVPRGGLDLRPCGRAYDLRFRTHPDPGARAALDFAVLGDYGVGVVVDGESSRRQRRISEVLAGLVDEPGVRLVIGTGDNVYRGQAGRVRGESGGNDDDWYSSFYQPYRYALARVPFYPTVGNHDTSDSETADDREQVRDNFLTDLRFSPEAAGERASADPGMFYRFGFGADVEFVCLDTSLADPLPSEHFFESPRHDGFLDRAFPADDRDGPTWRFPFSHHPTYCAGPHHPNTESMIEKLVPLFHRSGVRAAFAGHEHNFQLSRADGIHYFLTGAGGKLREDPPQDFAAAHTVAWSAQSHLLLARVDGGTLTVTPYASLEDGAPQPMTALTPDNAVIEVPFVVLAG